MKEYNWNTKYRLEYNEKQGGFHFDNGTHKENTFGWKTICTEITDKDATKFCYLIYKKYPSTNLKKKKNGIHPTDEQIRQEFINFLLNKK